MRRYSPREVAKALGLNVETVRRAIRRGELQAEPTGRRGHYWHVYQPAVEAWVQLRAESKAAATKGVA